MSYLHLSTQTDSKPNRPGISLLLPGKITWKIHGIVSNPSGKLVLFKLVCVTDPTNGSNEAWMSRQTLQDLYQKLLVIDLEYALDKKVEQDLWVWASAQPSINSLRGGGRSTLILKDGRESLLNWPPFWPLWSCWAHFLIASFFCFFINHVYLP